MTTLRRGKVTAFPSGKQARVESISTFDGETEYALPGSSITVTLDHDIDLKRGGLIAGQGCVIGLDGWVPREMVLVEWARKEWSG